MASFALSTDPYAVSMITGRSPSSFRSSSRVAMPPMPGIMTSTMAASTDCARARSSPSSPVAALALPLLRTTAVAWPSVASRWCRLTTTGAAARRLVVNTPAAATGAPSAVATTARSGSPGSFTPA